MEHESHVRRRQKCGKESWDGPTREDSCDPLYDIDTLEDVRNWMIATTTNRKEEKSSEVEEDEFTKLVGEVV